MPTMTRRAALRGAALAAAAGAGLSLAACSGGGEASEEGSERDATQVVVSMTPASEPAAGFDPLVDWGCGEHVHEPLIQSTLVRTTADMGLVNDLATEYSCSGDGLTWTFTIRDDVRFTDGEPLVAGDVAFTVNGIAHGEASACDLSMVEEAVALDGRTVEIRLNKPYNALLYTLAVVGIVPEHAYGDDYGSNPVGSGRYVLEQWDRGQQAILVANPDYYGDAPLMERLVVVFMEEDASLAAAESGEVDVAYTAATLVDSLPAGYELLRCESVDSRGVSLPMPAAGGTRTEQGVDYEVGNDVTCDVAVRRAINYGIDRDTFIDNVLDGYGHVAYCVGDGMPWYSEDMACGTDAVRAKGLLDEAGWEPGEDGVRERDGVRAAFDLWYPSGDSVRQACAEEFANQMAELGIEVSPRGGSWDEIYARQYADPVMWGWGANNPNEVYNVYYSTGSSNFSGYASASTDSYMDRALACPTVEESFGLWQDAMWDGAAGCAPQGDAPWVWFANVDHLYFKREGLSVAEQKPHPHGHGWSLVNNVDAWSWN